VEINFRILGRPAVRIADRFEADWTQPKPRGMFSALLLRPGEAVPAEELIDWMWPDGKAPREPVTTLYTYRKRIAAALDRMDSPPKIHVRNGTYRLEVDREEVDFYEFRRLTDQARTAVRQGDHAGAARILATAVDDLWTGTPVPDLNGERAVNWRRMAEAEHLIPAHGALLHSLCCLGEYAEALRRLADLSLHQQADLSMVKNRMVALHGLRRYDEATDYYFAQRRRLTSDGSHDEADELKFFYDRSLARSRRPQAVESRRRHVEVPHLLPHDVAEFTGREVLLQHLDVLTTTADGGSAAAVAVLSGQPGVGKTALAVHWAHLAADRFEGGQLYRDLNGFGEGPKVEQAEVVAEFLAALGFPPEGIPSEAGRMAKLRSLLSGPRALVVLDNVRDSEHVRPLLDCLSNCAVVLTSRQNLRGLARARGASVPVSPLTYNEAKQWMAKWLGSRAASEVTAANELASLCGGIALTLRVVAEHAISRPAVALAEFVEELRDEQTLLGLGDHGDGPGGSVGAALGWSYHALNAEEQRCFRLLGINPGSDISLAAASALLGRERREAKRCLDVLVDAHLLGQPHSRDRYKYHTLLARYARELGAGAEQSAAEERLLSFYTHSGQNADRIVLPHKPPVQPPPLVDGVQPVEFQDENGAVMWVARERANINTVLCYAVSRNMHSYVSAIPSIIGEIFARLGYGDDAAHGLQMAIRSAQTLGEVYNEASWRGNLACIQLGQREFESARENTLSAKAVFERLGMVFPAAIMDYQLGRVFVERGDVLRGIEIQLGALAVFQRINSEEAAERALTATYRLGEAYRRAGNLEAATSYCQDALWRAGQMGESHHRACILGELAVICLERGDLVEARGYCGRALESHGYVHAEEAGKIYATLGTVCLYQKDFRAAEQYARQALTYFRGARRVVDQAAALRVIAEALYRQARHDEAIEAWSLALSLLDAIGERQAAAEIRERIAEVTPAPPLIAQERTEPMRARPRSEFTL
jgi:tetratricopeptide (TPR) repeat protein/DNA-binding SARP family transcriptional activator